jgi:hypothetical protein
MSKPFQEFLALIEWFMEILCPREGTGCGIARRTNKG